MANSIDPFKKKQAPVPPAVDPTVQAARLARATGATPLPQTPPPAKPLPAGVTGNPPLPTNRVVGHVAPSGLTDIERATLQAAGWTPDVPLPTTPTGQKQLQMELSKMSSIEVPLPVNPGTLPVRPDAIPIESLPPETQSRFRTVVASIGQTEANEAARAAEQQKLAAQEMRVGGITAATQAANAAIAAGAKSGNNDIVYEVDLGQQPQTPAAAPPQQASPPPPPPAAPKPPVSETGANVPMAFCPHCDWDLSQLDIPEPAHQDKIAFLHSMLGQKPYVKQYPLFGGALEVSFRTLTMRELDIVYKQAAKDREDGKFTELLDFHEVLNRYRLMLQIQMFRSSTGEGTFKQFPDGYSKAANPQCDGTWVSEERESELPNNETGLPAIETYLVEELFKTEALFRIVHRTCNQFNRLVAKLEAMADHSDFLNPTETPS